MNEAGTNVAPPDALLSGREGPWQRAGDREGGDEAARRGLGGLREAGLAVLEQLVHAGVGGRLDWAVRGQPAARPSSPSGMHWTVNGADSIIALRTAEASSQWEATCLDRHNQTPAA